MFEYFHDIFEDTLEHIFDTCLRPDESMKLGEVDKFRQPRVWIRREVPVVARTIPLREEFPGRIDSDFRKDCKQEDQRDGLAAKADPNHPASPIRKSITNREANDAIELHLDR